MKINCNVDYNSDFQTLLLKKRFDFYEKDW